MIAVQFLRFVDEVLGPPMHAGGGRGTGKQVGEAIERSRYDGSADQVRSYCHRYNACQIRRL
jgi:hypothetical protein